MILNWENNEKMLFDHCNDEFSAFYGHKIGVGIRYSRLYGVREFKGFFVRSNNGITLFAGIDVGYANYSISDWFEANLMSIDFGFKF